ncbi:MAG: HmuY family protein [Candidatus Poribacteria bacterium]|nr:HmuY family protein [Candidatus Poribacteria bacterium]
MKRFMCLHNLIFSTILLFVVTFSIAVFTAYAELHQNSLTVDATDRENWAYLNLLEGKVVDIEDAATSLKWDLGFKRTAVIVNGGISGSGEAEAQVLDDISFEDVLEAPEGDYVSDTDQIATFARGDGWYTYTGPPNHWVLPNDKVYVLRSAAGNYAKLRFIGYYENNETKEGSGLVSIEYVLQDDGTRNFFESDPADVVARQKLTTTWAELKQN